MWRCFYTHEELRLMHAVFSTHVEVFLKGVSLVSVYDGLLHACGGVSAE